MKLIALIICSIFSGSLMAHTAVIDTSYALQELANVLKGANGFLIDYTMDVRFPNGDKDHIDGTTYIDTKNKIYYNDCKQSTMLYTATWYYQADHINKVITIVELKKENKKLSAEREKLIFGNGALSAFLDTVVIKKGKVTTLSYTNSTCHLAVSFPKKFYLKKMNFTYDTLSKIPLNCSVDALKPVDALGKELINVAASYTRFQKITDNSPYSTELLFTHAKNKITLKKYTSYKLQSNL